MRTNYSGLHNRPQNSSAGNWLLNYTNNSKVQMNPAARKQLNTPALLSSLRLEVIRAKWSSRQDIGGSVPRSFSLKLHHIGYVAKTIAPIAQQYTRQFGYEACTSIIHDPLQTAFVQFLKLPADEAYLELVAPDGPESKLMSAATRRTGLNHLCYTSGRLETMIEQFESEGMRLISEPKPGLAFAGRRICWLIGDDMTPIELVERQSDADVCEPGIA